MFINKCIHSEELEYGDLFLSDIFLETVGGRSVCILSKTRKSAREGKKKRKKEGKGCPVGSWEFRERFRPSLYGTMRKKGGEIVSCWKGQLSVNQLC